MHSRRLLQVDIADDNLNEKTVVALLGRPELFRCWARGPEVVDELRAGDRARGSAELTSFSTLSPQAVDQDVSTCQAHWTAAQACRVRSGLHVSAAGRPGLTFPAQHTQLLTVQSPSPGAGCGIFGWT